MTRRVLLCRVSTAFDGDGEIPKPAMEGLPGHSQADRGSLDRPFLRDGCADFVLTRLGVSLAHVTDCNSQGYGVSTPFAGVVLKCTATLRNVVNRAENERHRAP